VQTIAIANQKHGQVKTTPPLKMAVGFKPDSHVAGNYSALCNEIIEKV